MHAIKLFFRTFGCLVQSILNAIYHVYTWYIHDINMSDILKTYRDILAIQMKRNIKENIWLCYIEMTYLK